ncbi:MAG: potassium channel protein [Acidobacteriaceae bacterium]|nr:potassium channel protein [Acidobacteriaceae bacterium]
MARRVIGRIVLVAGLLVLTLCMGTVGFRVIEGYSVFDAFYMTLITITTVGYQELQPLSHGGRIFNSFLILFGVTAMFFSVGAMTQTIIELQLHNVYGKGRKKRMIEQMKNHFIVCGFGRVGRSACRELQRAGVQFVVIDRSEQRVERATQSGMIATMADATRDECLREAGVMRARGFISALATDADNVFVILSAKTLNPKLTVVTRAVEEAADDKLRRAGADIVFSPYSITGQRLAQALVHPHVIRFLDFTAEALHLNVGMEQVRVEATSDFASRRVGDLTARTDLGVIILGLRKSNGEMLFNPPPDTAISTGDYLVAMGRQAELRGLENVLGGVRS